VLWFERDWTPRVAPVCGRVFGLLGHPVAIELADALGPVLRRAGATEIERAPTLLRIAAVLLDALILGLVIAAAFALATFLPEEVQVSRSPLLLVLFGMALPAAYFVGFEVSPWRATPGKRVLHLEVRDRSGVSINWYQALGRFLEKLFSVISFWPMLISLVLSMRGRRMIHDWLSRSTVVRRNEEPQDTQSPVPRLSLIAHLSAARYDRTRDKTRGLLRLVKRYCLLRKLLGIPALAATIGSGYVVYHETGRALYATAAVLATLFLAGLIIGTIEKAGARHVKRLITQSPLNADERASLAGRLKATKKKVESKDDLIDPLLAILE
jgi:uncharacterized RDD family membrane protein YckC